MAAIKGIVRWVIVVIAIVFCCEIKSQTAPETYFIQFTDKVNTPFSISSPSQFLSAKAIARRQKQNIAITIQDLPVDPAYIDSVLSYDSVQLKCRSKWFNAITVVITDSVSLAEISSLGFVSQVRAVQTRKKDVEVDKDNFFAPRNNAYFSSDHIYGPAYNQIHMMNGDFLHDMGFMGQGMHVGVLDAGFNNVPGMNSFSNAFAEGRILPQYDFANSETDVFNNNSSHGSLVLGTMASYLPGQYVGTGPKANYFLWATENASSEYIVEEDYWVAGAEAADSAGMDVLNTSLGYSQFDDTLQNHTYTQMNGNTTRISIGTDMAVSKGMICVTSAGNSGNNSWFYITAPGDADSAITVGAVGPDRVYASFSSKGPSSDGNVKPNVATQGYQTQVYYTNNAIGPGNGTSFAAPVLTGLVACLWQAFPDKKNMEIVHAIEQSASHYNTPDSLTGYGIPDMKRAWEILNGTFTGGTELEVSLLQNLYTSESTLQLYSLANTAVDIYLFDVNGKKIHSLTVQLQAGEYTRLLLTGEMNLLSPGMYFLKIQAEGFLRTEKIVKG